MWCLNGIRLRLITEMSSNVWNSRIAPSSFAVTVSGSPENTEQAAELHLKLLWDSKVQKNNHLISQSSEKWNISPVHYEVKKPQSHSTAASSSSSVPPPTHTVRGPLLFITKAPSNPSVRPRIAWQSGKLCLSGKPERLGVSDVPDICVGWSGLR